ncbi:group II intron maturase-specific domain-containing protein [Streptomyces sp. NPDC046161]|uniref:group II intron maturase-specific domain-containing protein n=1 Tax=Streptomyces sp. NPDC046161 TaxID=3155132 RepID=UPI0033D2C280
MLDAGDGHISGPQVLGQVGDHQRLEAPTYLSFAELARRINPTWRAGSNYYGRFYRSALTPPLQRINAYLVRWIRKKYKRLAALRKALGKMREIAKRYPHMFAHWKVTTTASSGW